jgi:hypothetical protein
MKHKGHRTIPDFSKKKATSPPHVPLPKLERVVPPPQVERKIKPPATAAKSGQRGR